MVVPKFRAWFDSEMYDKPIVCDGEFYLDWYEFENGETHNDAILMQSTGLFDKNGQEIFEGDVIVYSENDNDIISENVIIKFGKHKNMDTVFKEEPVHVGLYIEVQKGTATFDVDSMYNGYEGCLTIIGNIYENPELVEVLDEK